MTKATATQNSGSANIKLSLQGGVDRLVDGPAVGSQAGEPLHDRDGRVRGNAADVAHRRFAGRRNGFFGFGEFDRQPLFQRLALGLGGRVELFAGLGADRLRARARGGELALIGFQRGVGLVPQLLRRGQIALDLVLAFVEQAADARQRNSRDDQIKRDEGHQQRHQLRSKAVLLERRKRGLVAAVCLGMGRRALCVAMTLSHGLLLFGRLRSGSRTSSARSVMDQSANSSSSAISSEKMPSASVTAKPKIRLPNWPWAAEGLRTAAAR